MNTVFNVADNTIKTHRIKDIYDLNDIDDIMELSQQISDKCKRIKELSVKLPINVVTLIINLTEYLHLSSQEFQ